MYGSYLIKVIQTGVQYLASIEDVDEAYQKGREYMPPETDVPLGNLYNGRIVPAVAPMRHLNMVLRDVTDEFTSLGEEAAADNMLQKRYLLLKTLAYNSRKEASATEIKSTTTEEYMYRHEAVFGIAYVLSGSKLHQNLLKDLHEGNFDQLIAHDIIGYVDGKADLDSDLSRVQQLATWMETFIGDQAVDKAELYNRMVETIDSWPHAQRQVITDARQTLQNNLETLQKIFTGTLKDSSFLLENPKQEFEDSMDDLAEQVVRRAQIISPKDKYEMMRLRTNMKRGRTTPRRQRDKQSGRELAQSYLDSPEGEIITEPAKISTCNTNNNSITPGVEGLIDTFVKFISQNQEKVREDLANMVTFLARRDLPPEQPRGVKTIGGAKVRFSTVANPDKLWTLYEFKPTEAVGLPTKTQIAKQSRIYFIKLDDGSIGVVGIEPRDKQNAFLRSIRIKAKGRG